MFWYPFPRSQYVLRNHSDCWNRRCHINHACYWRTMDPNGCKLEYHRIEFENHGLNIAIAKTNYTCNAMITRHHDENSGFTFNSNLFIFKWQYPTEFTIDGNAVIFDVDIGLIQFNRQIFVTWLRRSISVCHCDVKTRHCVDFLHYSKFSVRTGFLFEKRTLLQLEHIHSYHERHNFFRQMFEYDSFRARSTFGSNIS